MTPRRANLQKMKSAGPGTSGRPRPSENSALDHFVGVVLGLVAVSNLAQGMWISSYPWLDLTILGYVVSLPLALLALSTSLRRPGAGPVVLILAAVLFGYFSPALNPGAYDKRLEIAVGVLYTFLLAYLVLNNRRRAIVFFATVVGLAFSVMLGQVLAPDNPALLVGRRTPAGLNPIGAGRVLGAGVVVSFGTAISVPSRRHRALLLGLTATLLAGLVATGSRGPVLGVLAAVAVILWSSPSLRGATKWLATGFLAAGVLWAFRQLSLAGDRLATSSDTGRTDLFHAAIKIGFENPWGIGWGNFYNYIPPGLVNSVQGYDQYPHNIVLEFLAETGWLPTLIFVLATLTIVTITVTRQRGSGGLTLAALLTFSATSALFSSDVVGNRLLWVTLGSAAASAGSIQFPDTHHERSSHGRTLTKRNSIPQPSLGSEYRDHPR